MSTPNHSPQSFINSMLSMATMFSSIIVTVLQSLASPNSVHVSAVVGLDVQQSLRKLGSYYTPVMNRGYS